MLDEKQVIKKMKERGFLNIIYFVKNGYDLTSITFSTVDLNDVIISCTVDLIQETFAFAWCVPYSINKLSTPNCGSFFNDEHFNKLYKKMLKHARILYLELQE